MVELTINQVVDALENSYKEYMDLIKSTNPSSSKLEPAIRAIQSILIHISWFKEGKINNKALLAGIAQHYHIDYTPFREFDSLEEKSKLYEIGILREQLAVLVQNEKEEA